MSGLVGLSTGCSRRDVIRSEASEGEKERRAPPRPSVPLYRPDLQIRSHWGLGLQCMNGEGAWHNPDPNRSRLEELKA